MLSLQDRVDQGVMTMRGYSTFSKAPALLEPPPSDCFMSISWHSSEVGGGLTLCKEAFGVFYSSSWLGKWHNGPLVWLDICVYVQYDRHMSGYRYKCVYVLLDTFTQICVCVCVCVYIYIYIYIYICICVCVCVCVNTPVSGTAKCKVTKANT